MKMFFATDIHGSEICWRKFLNAAASAPKSMKWKLRANVGDRVRWYELPEEVAH